MARQAFCGDGGESLINWQGREGGLVLSVCVYEELGWARGEFFRSCDGGGDLGEMKSLSIFCLYIC